MKRKLFLLVALLAVFFWGFNRYVDRSQSKAFAKSEVPQQGLAYAKAYGLNGAVKIDSPFCGQPVLPFATFFLIPIPPGA